jgi:2,3-bisphosphoglycerate-dependent phosphoglycerate mutase
VRHGQSIWNKTGRFSGWVDVPLNDIGVKEAKLAGKQLKEQGFDFKLAFTSCLVRATTTLDLIC